MNMIDKNIDPNNFTQKDLMIHLLDASLHTVTREELKENNQKLETSLKDDIANLDTKIDKVETNLNAKIDKVEVSLKADMSKLETSIQTVSAKFDKLQWLIVATIVASFSKDYILSLLQTAP